MATRIDSCLGCSLVGGTTNVYNKQTLDLATSTFNAYLDSAENVISAVNLLVRRPIPEFLTHPVPAPA